MIPRWFSALAMAAALSITALAFSSEGQQVRDRRLGVSAARDCLPEEALAQTATAAGAGSILVPLDWRRVQPRRGSFDWSAYDRLVNAVRQQGIEVVFVLGPMVEWASGAPRSEPQEVRRVKPPKDWADWESYVGAAVAHFRGRVRYWQVWESFDFAHFRAPGSQIVVLAERTFRAAKRADPNAKLILPEPGGIDLGWIVGLRESATWGRFDILGLRPFRQSAKSLSLALAVLQSEILKDSAKPVWIVGWEKGLGFSEPAEEPGLAERLARVALGSGVGRIFDRHCPQPTERPAPAEAGDCSRAAALAALPALETSERVFMDLGASPAEQGLYNTRYRDWPGGRVAEQTVAGRQALASRMQDRPLLTEEDRRKENPWFYFDVDDRFLFCTYGRRPVAITVEVRGASAAEQAGFNIYYDAGERHRFSAWQWIAAGPDKWFSYRILLPDAWFANKDGYDFRINAKGSKEDIYISRVEVEPVSTAPQQGTQPQPLAPAARPPGPATPPSR